MLLLYSFSGTDQVWAWATLKGGLKKMRRELKKYGLISFHEFKT
jgi:hypothetical protein